MNIGKKLLGNISKKGVAQKALTSTQSAVTTAQNAELQKAAKELFSQNIAGLEKFAKTELPKTIADQQSAIAGLEQLAKNVKGMMK